MSKKKKPKVRLPRKKTEYAEKSKAIRLSPEVDELLLSMSRRNESYDNIIRRLLAMPTVKYSQYAAKEMFVINDGTHVFTDEAVALGEAIRLSVKNKTKKPAPILKVRTAC